MHISDPGDQEVPYEAQPAPAHLLGRVLDNVVSLTPDIRAADAASGVTPDKLNGAVPVGEGYYVYNDLSRYALTPSKVGLGHGETITDIDQLRERAEYDQLTLGSESNVHTVGSVDELVDRALTDPHFLPVVRRHERQFPVGGMIGSHSYREGVGVSYYPRDILLRDAPFGIGVTNPAQEGITVADAREWAERLTQARRERGQSDGSEG